MSDSDPGAICLRDGVEADVDRLFELDQLCFAVGVAYSLGEFRRLLRSRKTQCVIAEEENVLTGFVIVQEVVIRKSLGGHIITLDVAPGFRRRGIGRLLMEQIEGRMRAAGAEWLRLEVAENNSAACQFYLGFGFTSIGKIPDYYEGAIDGIVMVKELPSKA